jgi:Protein of unknown function (DUF4231)
MHQRAEGNAMTAAQKARAQAPKFDPLWDRLQANIEWYDKKAKANQHAYKASKITIIVLAILIPVLAEYGYLPGLHDSRALLVGFASGAILLLEGLQALNKWQENWILYRATCEGLRNEQHLFAEKAGPYAGVKPDAAQRLLAERTSSLVMAEHSKWVHARADKAETTTGT